MAKIIKRKQPTKPEKWLQEIRLAIADVQEAVPFGHLVGAPRKRSYPMPPLRGTAFIEKMTAAAKTIGWHPFPGPAAINSRT